jgi:4-aminobutyrate aminotransferase-like enzyme
LRYELAEKLAPIMPAQALPRTNYEVSGTEAAVHLALTHTKRRHIVTFASCFHGMGLGTKVLSGLDGRYGTYLEGWGGSVIKRPTRTASTCPPA